MVYLCISWYIYLIFFTSPCYISINVNPFATNVRTVHRSVAPRNAHLFSVQVGVSTNDTSGAEIHLSSAQYKHTDKLTVFIRLTGRVINDD